MWVKLKFNEIGFLKEKAKEIMGIFKQNGNFCVIEWGKQCSKSLGSRRAFANPNLVPVLQPWEVGPKPLQGS